MSREYRSNGNNIPAGDGNVEIKYGSYSDNILLKNKRQILNIQMEFFRLPSEVPSYRIYIYFIISLNPSILVGPVSIVLNPTGDPQLENGYAGLGAKCYIHDFSRGIKITLTESLNIDKCLYKKDDLYDIIFGLTALSIPKFDVKFIRLNGTDPNDKCPSKDQTTLLRKNNIFQESIIVPSININFQSLIDGSDIGNVIFTILDKFQYYKYTTPIIPGHQCQTLTINNPKTTIFDKLCSSIGSIMRGKGNTAWEKTVYFFDNGKANFSDIYNFFIEGIVKYSMLKYILSKNYVWKI